MLMIYGGMYTYMDGHVLLLLGGKVHVQGFDLSHAHVYPVWFIASTASAGW